LWERRGEALARQALEEGEATRIALGTETRKPSTPTSWIQELF
jgi:hypothetical protein